MGRKRLIEFIGTLMVGDMIVSLIWPQAHCRVWLDLLPFRWWNPTIRWFEERPTLMRAIGLAEGGLMLGWLNRMYRDV